MTAVRLPSGGLLVHSPTRFDAGLEAALDRLGPIEHLIAPNSVHWTFLTQWQLQCADAAPPEILFQHRPAAIA